MFVSSIKLVKALNRPFVAAASTAAVFSLATSGSTALASGSSSAYRADRLIVAFDRGVSDSLAAGTIEEAGAKAVVELPSINGVVVDVGSPADRQSTLESLQLAEDVRFVEPDRKITVSGTPSDPMFPQLWGMTKIEAPAAWDKYSGGAVTVAVTDTGIDPSHPDLDGNLWVNPREVAGNGRDDDGNGVVDDINGVNFSNGANSGNPFDGHGHGTHVAGTIAAESGNGVGVVGVNPRAKILSAKFLTDAGWGYTSDAIRVIDYARSMGARVINASWGGGSYSKALEDSIARAGAESRTLFVAAAGNDGTDNDPEPSYPASYELDNVVSVAASTQSDGLAYFSNYGACSVDLVAPGYQILSSLPGSRYAAWSGTSMATPHVAGVASLLAARSPGLGHQELKARLMDSVDKVGQPSGKSVTGGRLNARKALESTATKPPVGCPPSPKAPANAAAPAITGTPMVEETLTATAGTWDNDPTSISYQWYRCYTADLRGCYPIQVATGSTYSPKSSDVGEYLAVEIEASNGVGTAYAHSDATAQVMERPPRPNPELSIGGESLRDVIRNRSVTFTVRCNVEPCEARLRIKVTSRKSVRSSGRAKRVSTIATRSSTSRVGTEATAVSVSLSKKQVRNISRSLRKKRVVEVTVSGYVLDEDGESSEPVSRKLRIRR